MICRLPGAIAALIVLALPIAAQGTIQVTRHWGAE